MFDYFYFKLYKATLKTSLYDIPRFAACVYLGGLIGTNLLLVYLFLVKIDILPYIFTDKNQGGILFFFIILLCVVVYNKKKHQLILDKYSKESNDKRIRGNVIVFTYIIISFLMIFAVAFYKSGKL